MVRFKGGFWVKPRLWIFHCKSRKSMNLGSKMASEGQNEHTLPHFTGRVGCRGGPPSSGDLGKTFLTSLHKPYLQFGAVYGWFLGETAPLDFSSKIIEIHGFSLQNGFRESKRAYFAPFCRPRWSWYGTTNLGRLRKIILDHTE